MKIGMSIGSHFLLCFLHGHFILASICVVSIEFFHFNITEIAIFLLSCKCFRLLAADIDRKFLLILMN